MTSLLYFVQASVVFLCPVFFGWVVLRRVVREHDWLVLVPGSVVVGCIALMATMNELRYWLEMPVGAWFTYKLMLAAALGLLIFTRRPRFGPRLAGGARRKLWTWLALAGTAMTALYFGVPASRGLLNDSWWFHYPAATLVQDLKYFPLPSVFAPDDPLYYHFGPDILAGTWAYLLDCPVQTGFVAIVCIFAPCAFLLGYALLLRGCRSHLGALAGAAFLVVGGNLLFLRLPSAGSFEGLRILEKLNSGSVDGLLKLMFTPSHACGIPAVLVGVVFFWRFCVRPSWPLAALLGLWAGALTLIAEWYFFPFIGAIGLILLAKALIEIRRTHCSARSRPLVWLRVAPLVIAVGWGFFNNSYVSGIFGHFWMHNLHVTSVIGMRMEQSRFDQDSRDAEARQVYASLAHKPLAPKRPRGFAYGNVGDTPLPDLPWTPPGLVPLKLNLRHFGLIPSWEGAGSSGGTFVPLLSFRFIAECTPVILLGLPFGLWLAFRRPQPILSLLALLAFLSVLPPIFLDWGFRSTDFLRFFTGAFSFSAMLLGWLVGFLWERGPRPARVAVVLICACALVNPFIIGLLGLNGSTFTAVKDVNQSAGSLKKASQEETAALAAEAKASGAEAPQANGIRPASSPAAVVSASLSPAQRREVALARLAELARRYLYPQTLGRERAIVIVPMDAIPPTEVFPEWLKLATLAHVQLPIGWYWNDSYYAAYYRQAVTNLNPASITALDARWVIVSNLFGPPPPDAVNLALSDPRRFIFARSYASGPYYLTIFRALPYNAPPPGATEE